MSRLTVTGCEMAVLPAASSMVAVNVCPAPSLATGCGGGQYVTPEPLAPSEHVQVMVAGVLIQPPASSVGLSWPDTVGGVLSMFTMSLEVVLPAGFVAVQVTAWRPSPLTAALQLLPD